jgi:hypothetical protein
MRGPTPRKCRECLGPDRVVALRSVPQPKQQMVPDQLRYSAKTTVESVLYADKMALALAMRMDYCDWPEIASVCGYSSEQSAYIAVKTAMSHRQQALDEPLDHVRLRELHRLDRLSAKAMKVLETDHHVIQGGRVVTRELESERVDPVTGKTVPAVIVELVDDGPTLAAIDRLLKLSESRRKLLGLDAATKVENDVTVKYTVEGVADGDMP